MSKKNRRSHAMPDAEPAATNDSSSVGSDSFFSRLVLVFLIHDAIIHVEMLTPPPVSTITSYFQNVRGLLIHHVFLFLESFVSVYLHCEPGYH